MTTQNLILLFLISLSFIVYGQTHKGDTIDYIFYGKTYVLDKITESKTNKKVPIKYGGPLLTLVHDGSSGGMNSNFAKNDTIMTVEWDLELSYNVAEHHAAAKVDLNRHTNLLTMEKYKLSIYGTFSKKVIRKFKIIKWTQSQVILLDFSNLEKNRRYYFK
jgi:hypothetical protein